MGACTFCSAEASLVPIDVVRICVACARRIANLASAAEAADVWDVRVPATAADEEMAEAAARVAAELSANDADSRYYLAAAYRQMGMHRDAVRAAGDATAAAVDDGKMTAALRLLLTVPLLLDAGLAALRVRLKRMTSN